MTPVCRLLVSFALAVWVAALPAQTRPGRIISIVPALTEALFSMGAGPRVVGVGSFARHPAEVDSLPKVGGLIDPDMEQIIALTPDLVVLYGSQEDQLAQLERAGISVFVYADGVGGAFHGDLVLVEIEKPRRSWRGRRGGGGRRDRDDTRLRRAQLIDVVRRRKSPVLGRFWRAESEGGKSERDGFVEPIHKAPAAEIFIPKGMSGEAKDGAKVLVKLLDGWKYGVYARGEVTHVVEDEGSYESDLELVISE